MSCDRTDLAFAYAVRALPAGEAAAFQAHLASCAHCRGEVAALQPVVGAFVAWPTDVLRPSASLQERLAERIGGAKPAAPQWTEPPWEKVAPGISVKMLANDEEKHVVSMLVRLEPGASYPPHTHVGVEELHLLDGELWIEERLLRPGDYNYGRPGDSDQRVYSETGCTCVLITSTKDILR
jgi:anti-sigma factor ChrR (cupin superfamily)